MAVLTPFSGASCCENKHSVLLQRFTFNHSNLQGPHTGHHIQDDNTPPPQIGNSRPTNSTPCRSKDQETGCQGLEHHGSGVNNPPSLTSLFGDFSPANLPLNYHLPWS